MRRYWSGLFVAGVLAATAALGAQAQGQRPVSAPPADVNASPGVQEAPRAPAAQVRTQSTVTVTGCLQNAPSVAASAQGRGSNATMAGFVLANPQMTASGRTAGGAIGTTGADTKTSYRLEGDDKLMSPHLNHQVRVTGTLQSSAVTAAVEPAAATPAAPVMLKVESVEMVAATCTPATPADSARPAPAAEPARPAVPAVPPDRP